MLLSPYISRSSSSPLPHVHRSVLYVCFSIAALQNLEPIIQSEVSQKEKYRYHILMHIYGI